MHTTGFFFLPVQLFAFKQIKFEKESWTWGALVRSDYYKNKPHIFTELYRRKLMKIWFRRLSFTFCWVLLKTVFSEKSCRGNQMLSSYCHLHQLSFTVWSLTGPDPPTTQPENWTWVNTSVHEPEKSGFVHHDVSQSHLLKSSFIFTDTRRTLWPHPQISVVQCFCNAWGIKTPERGPKI